jgi:hypothetical protein
MAFLAIVAIVYSTWGSLLGFVRWWHNQSVIISSPTGFAIPVDRGERIVIPVHLENGSRSSIQVTGITASCGCLAVRPIPFSIPARSSACCLVVFDSSRYKTGKYTFQIQFHMSKKCAPVSARIPVTITEVAATVPVRNIEQGLKPIPVESPDLGKEKQ